MKFKSIIIENINIYKDKKSKFIGLVFSINCIDDVKKKLLDVKNEYPDANHHCYAYRFLNNNNEIYRYNDDGEPNGTAGKPIYGQLKSFELYNVLIIVVRYFGGTKLGVSGLITAYKNAAKELILNSIIIENETKIEVLIKIENNNYSLLMRILNSDIYEIKQNDYIDNLFNIKLYVNESEINILQNKIKNIPNIYIELKK